MKTFIFMVAILCLLSGCAYAWTDNQIANAIFKAENSKSHPYGILKHYRHTTPRQSCLNTIKNQRIRHANHKCGKDFLTCLRDRYCPLKASNDPTGLNKNWIKNVNHFLTKGV